MESPHSSRPVSAHINWCPFPPSFNLFDCCLIPVYVQSLQSIAMLFLMTTMTEVGYECIVHIAYFLVVLILVSILNFVVIL